MSDEIDSGAVPARPKATSTTSPSGIGGWLILPMLGLFGSIGAGLYGLFTGGTDALGMLGDLSGGQQSTVIVELIIQIVLGIIVPIYLLVQMFNHRRGFPRAYVVWVVVIAIFSVVDMLLDYAAFSAAYDAGYAQIFDSKTIESLISAAIGLFIWVPYMNNSLRVRNTFVK